MMNCRIPHMNFRIILYIVFTCKSAVHHPTGGCALVLAPAAKRKLNQIKEKKKTARCNIISLPRIVVDTSDAL